MSKTLDDLASFDKFVAARVRNGGAHLLLEDLLREWRASQETEETAADIRASLADFEAGRTDSLDQAFENVRRRMGIGE